MAGSGCGVVAGNDDQFTATEVCERSLDGALGKARRVGKHSYACDDRFPFSPRGLPVKFMNMSYACDDIDKTYAELKKRGVEFEGPPQKQPWGTYAMFKDSEGNRFVVSSD
jgi:uncharacterized glyoxalase superfamily protein PhnB